MTTASASRRRPWRRNLAVAARWLHIYLSMVSFALVLFFAVTGLTLNHPDWFLKQQRTTERHGTVAKDLLGTGGADADRLRLAELFRAREHVHGAVSDFRVDESQISVSFKAPGYTADAFVDRATGKYDLTEVQSGFAAVMNDLHKGRDAGRVWGALIDASAVLLTLVSATGLVLVWFLSKRRVSGLLWAAGAAVGCWVVWRVFVP